VGKSKAPKAPDPFKTAQAQAGMNRDTALTEAALGTGTQVNPWGTVSYDSAGTRSFIDSRGKTVTVPIYTQTTSLSPEQQAIFDQTQAAETNLATLANEQSGFLQEYLAEPFSFNNQDAANWAYDLGAQRLDPRMAQQRASIETRLANQGIAPGSRAWQTAMDQASQAENDAYNQLMLTGRGQAFAENLATRNQPINEITALLSGSQVSNPAAMGAAPQQTPGVGGVDYTGLVNQKFAADTANYQNQMGGLFGMGGALLGAAGNAGGFGALFSDERLKTDIRRIGQTDAGVPLYIYRYITGGPPQIGVLAQELAETQPEAVSMHDSGFLQVHYGRVR